MLEYISKALYCQFKCYTVKRNKLERIFIAMDVKKLIWTSLIGVCMSSGIATAETLQDCLLENLKGVTSDIAAKAITDACQAKFRSDPSQPNDSSEVRSILADEIVLTLNKPLFSSETPEYRIPVPKGNWQKVGEATRHRVQPPMFSEVWVNVIDNVVHHLMYVDYNKSGNENRWKSSRLCDRTNLHFIEKIEPNRDGEKQNCLVVNHFRLSGGNDKNPATKQAKDWARENQIAFPSTAIVHQHHLAYRRYLNFWVGYNPEVEGFPAPTDASWDSNDWHQDRIIGDDKRQAYIQKVLKAGKETHEAIVPQFDFR